MGGVKKVYIEIYEKFDGKIPIDYTLSDYIAEVNKNKQLQEYEKLKKDSEGIAPK